MGYREVSSREDRNVADPAIAPSSNPDYSRPQRRKVSYPAWARGLARGLQFEEDIGSITMARISFLGSSAQRGSRSWINGSLAEKLKITDEQKERIEEKAEELQKKLDERIAKLREQMQAELIAELTPEQQAQYKEIMGETFTFEREQRADRGGDRGGDRGARGGRGGDRGPGGAGRDRGGNRGDGRNRENGDGDA